MITVSLGGKMTVYRRMTVKTRQTAETTGLDIGEIFLVLMDGYKLIIEPAQPLEYAISKNFVFKSHGLVTTNIWVPVNLRTGGMLSKCKGSTRYETIIKFEEALNSGNPLFTPEQLLLNCMRHASATIWTPP